MAHDAVLDLMIESEARRAHDLTLATKGAEPATALTEFTDVIKQDIEAARVVQKTYSFDRVQPHAVPAQVQHPGGRLVGITLHGTTTLVTRDAAGKVLSQETQSYDKSWGLARDRMTTTNADRQRLHRTWLWPSHALAGSRSGSYTAGGSMPNVSARRTKRLNSAAS